jgi:hypothetical protein
MRLTTFFNLNIISQNSFKEINCILDKFFCNIADVAQTLETTDKNHSINLQNLCRICGKIANKRMSKTKFADEIERQFQIDVKSENSYIFPQNICLAHGAVFYRCRSALKKMKLSLQIFVQFILKCILVNAKYAFCLKMIQNSEVNNV